MSLPLAAPPTSPTPGLWLTVDLTPRGASVGAQGLRALVVGPKSDGSGTLTVDTEIRQVFSLEDAETAAGVGSLIALTCAELFKADSIAQVFVAAPTSSLGANATNTITAGGAPTTGTTIRIWIQGLAIDVPWNVGEAATVWRDRAVTAINRYTRQLLVTASNGVAPGAVTLTAKAKGPTGNDVRVRAQIIEGAGATLTVASATLTGGTTECDYTSVLASCEGQEFDFIVPCLSNADVQSTSGNLSRLDTHITGLDSGINAKLQMGVVGHTGLRTAVTASTIARNEQQISVIEVQNGESLPCEVGGRVTGICMARRRLQPNNNFIGEELAVRGSADPVSDNATTAESDAALNAGLSTTRYNAIGQLEIGRLITTYSKTPQGAQLLPTDVGEIHTMYDIGKAIRAWLPVEFANAFVTRDLEEGDDDLPERVVEERDVRAAIAGFVRATYGNARAISMAQFNADVAAGLLLARVNDVDESQVDIFIPLKPLKATAKLGVYVAKTS